MVRRGNSSAGTEYDHESWCLHVSFHCTALSPTQSRTPTPNTLGTTPTTLHDFIMPSCNPSGALCFPRDTAVKAWSDQYGSSGEESLATTQSRPSLHDSSCNPKSVYQNYRCWQCFKSLARRHHPQSPDTEALSCFLIPVLRSLARRKPTMTLEEGLWRSVQEWEHKSNFDRMIFYEMAEKFMEFEAEEELQIRKSQQRNVSVCLPPPVSRHLDPQKPSSTVAGQHPVFVPRKGDPKVQPLNQQQHRPQCPWEAKQPNEIPPKAVKEYVEIMEGLLGPAHSATVEPDAKLEEEEYEQQQEDTGMYPDPGLLSYNDKLCSQEEFITKVSWDSRFGIRGFCKFGIASTKHLEFGPGHCN
ncbi:NUT family member 2D-like [Elephas maximus indicus]|uniref:NUT family member 2D-like n=1 Tax=Elephas maximus indicus TaxID=99487 RepID=UPI0021167C1A|nr:NUT family member 2D-like [Elephas maximus indicus]